MKRVLVLAAFLILGGSTLAVADHVTEPTTPITSLDIAIFKYAEGENSRFMACDGTETKTMSQARMHPYIGVDPATRTGASEHWDMAVSVWQPRPNGLERSWFQSWFHQNMPAHSRNPWLLGRGVEYDFDQAGLWMVRATAQGLESGNVLTFECRFRVELP